MAFPFNAGGVYEVSAEGTLASAIECRNVFHLQLTGSGTLSETQGLDDIEQWLTALITVIKAMQATVAIWKGFKVSNLEGTPMSVSRVFSSPIAGTNAGTLLPTGCCFLTYMPTGVRRRQLRKYWWGFIEASTDTTGEWASSAVTYMAGVAPLLLPTQSMANGTWVVGSYQTGVPGSFVRPSSAVQQVLVSYQRRRRRGRGI